jgi:hypothetical protein
MILIFPPVIRDKQITSHWALFIPNQDGLPTGTLVHLVVDKHSSFSTKGPAQPKTQPDFRATASTVYSTCTISGAKATVEQVEEAAKKCWNQNTGKYNAVNNNCQMSVLDILKELNRLYPNDVSQKAIDDAPQKLNDFFKENKAKVKEFFKIPELEYHEIMYV